MTIEDFKARLDSNYSKGATERNTNLLIGCTGLEDSDCKEAIEGAIEICKRGSDNYVFSSEVLKYLKAKDWKSVKTNMRKYV